MNSEVSDKERATQERVIALFQQELGYEYLGNWASRDNNRCVDEQILSHWLTGRGVSQVLINKTLHDLGQVAALGEGQNLYDANKAVYAKLRYGSRSKKALASRPRRFGWSIGPLPKKTASPSPKK